MSNAREIIQAALAATTPGQAAEVQEMIVASLGQRNERPVGDKWNNHGLLGASGSFDLKLIEPVTNMQDAILERFAREKFGGPHLVPYKSPHQAAEELVIGTPDEQAALARVTFKECADDPSPENRAERTKMLTVIFDDRGCGLTPQKIPGTVFGIGGSHKEDALYLQGAFGMGGAMTYRNAEAVVLVSRRAPSLLQPGEDDQISVAVVQWQPNTKGSTAFYLVADPWTEPGDIAAPWAAPASEFPSFEPGTHLALVAYRVDGFHRKREGDEKSFDVVANTRLFKPVLPITFVNETTRGRRTKLFGLGARLENSTHDFKVGEETLPFNYEGETYLLPMRYTLFQKPRESGGRDKFVARDHVVVFTSNGQVHHHWNKEEFQRRTGLTKLRDRVLVVVDTDELPIRLRTSLFTADRNDLVRGGAAIKLEETVASTIRDWNELIEANAELLREALKGSTSQNTREIARRIGRALEVAGFGGSNRAGNAGGGPLGGHAGGGGGTTKPIQLYNDPTRVAGPRKIRAAIGETRSVTYVVDAYDSFFEGRGVLAVASNHPDLEQGREITVGKGRSGRVRVMIAVPDTLEPGDYELTATLAGWHKASGGIGATLSHATTLSLVEEIPGSGAGDGKASNAGEGRNGTGEGTNIVLRWTNPHDQEGWEKITVGSVEEIPASVLAEDSEYADLASLGETRIPTILLNEEYPPFKKYLEGRNKEVGGFDRQRSQYATGTGTALVLLNGEMKAREKDGRPLPDAGFVAEAQRSAARAVLAVMPASDKLAKEAGLD